MPAINNSSSANFGLQTYEMSVKYLQTGRAEDDEMVQNFMSACCLYYMGMQEARAVQKPVDLDTLNKKFIYPAAIISESPFYRYHHQSLEGFKSQLIAAYTIGEDGAWYEAFVALLQHIVYLHNNYSTEKSAQFRKEWGELRRNFVKSNTANS